MIVRGWMVIGCETLFFGFLSNLSSKAWPQFHHSPEAKNHSCQTSEPCMVHLFKVIFQL